MMPLSDFSPLVEDLTQYENGHGACQRIAPKGSNELPGKVGPGVSRKVILRSETFVELGGPETASSSFVLVSNDVSHDGDGIYIIGNDIPSLKKKSVAPFGFVITLYGQGLNEEDCEKGRELLQATDWAEGYMTRLRPGSVWGRVSKKAVRRGFDFEELGSAIIHLAHKKVRNVESVEVLFVTSSEEDVRKIDEIGEKARVLTREIRRHVWAEKGIDLDCPLGGHCGSCKEKDTCDGVRDIARIRKSLHKEDGSSERKSCYA
jgi:CO dehydrogenase/acetyl-CoA synthase beta subunit